LAPLQAAFAKSRARLPFSRHHQNSPRANIEANTIGRGAQGGFGLQSTGSPTLRSSEKNRPPRLGYGASASTSFWARHKHFGRTGRSVRRVPPICGPVGPRRIFDLILTRDRGPRRKLDSAPATKNYRLGPRAQRDGAAGTNKTKTASQKWISGTEAILAKEGSDSRRKTGNLKEKLYFWPSQRLARQPLERTYNRKFDLRCLQCSLKFVASTRPESFRRSRDEFECWCTGLVSRASGSRLDNLVTRHSRFAWCSFFQISGGINPPGAACFFFVAEIGTFRAVQAKKEKAREVDHVESQQDLLGAFLPVASDSIPQSSSQFLRRRIIIRGA